MNNTMGTLPIKKDVPKPIPSFAFFCNLPEMVKEPHKRFLENKFRENFNFKGAPIQIYVMGK